MHFVPVILCGGSGSRLWPVSRDEYAKPFARLPGMRDCLLAQTYARLAAAPAHKAVMTVAAADSLFLCRSIAAENGVAGHLLLGEPAAHNTAPALAAAARWAAAQFGDDVLLFVMPADHLVQKPQQFWQAAQRAMQTAANGGFALLGMTPDYPATGYGYIECGEKNNDECFAVRRFVEKPDSQTATEFLAAGNFLWNAGVFCFTPRTLFAELKTCAPDIFAAVQKLAVPEQAGAATAADEWRPAAGEYAAFPNISFDYAVMEKTKHAAVSAAADAGWSDVGTWKALAAAVAGDDNGNRIDGGADDNVLLVDCDDCFVSAGGGRLVAGVDLSGLHIIDSPDALLVSSADSAERVREVHAALKKAGRSEATVPATVRRPWGDYTVLSEGEGHKVKRITVLPGAALSLQSHRHRSEHWTTVCGVMNIVIDEREFAQGVNESCFVPQGAKHRMKNKTDAPAVIIEVQVGDYLGEDDITRYEDIYGRV